MRILALLVMDHARAVWFEQQLGASGVEILAAGDCSHARAILDSGLPVQVVLTDQCLPDGDWPTLLEYVKQRPLPAEVIVCAPRENTALLCEAVQNGAYDLLAEPYETIIVRRLVEAAAARNRIRCQNAQNHKSLSQAG